MEIVRLEKFNGRVERLDRSDLARRMDENPAYTLDFEPMLRRRWIALNGVSEGHVEAFVLNLRVLIQKTDGCSIRCLANKVYNGTSVPTDLRDRFTQARVEWQKFGDELSVFFHPDEHRNFGKHELFDILLNGVLAHDNPGKFEIAQRITMQGPVSGLIAAWFLSALRQILGVVRSIRDTNQELLRRIGPST